MKIDIESDYDLEIERVIGEIKKLTCKRSAQSPAKKVCIQLPDGLKQKATEIAEVLENETNAQIFIWLGTCFGACDIPNLPNDFDLLIQWGHTEWISQ
jgi:diphthamide biosynthesis enzyme Dph1/Dph2-like protein